MGTPEIIQTSFAAILFCLGIYVFLKKTDDEKAFKSMRDNGIEPFDLIRAFRIIKDENEALKNKIRESAE